MYKKTLLLGVFLSSLSAFANDLLLPAPHAVYPDAYASTLTYRNYHGRYVEDRYSEDRYSEDRYVEDRYVEDRYVETANQNIQNLKNNGESKRYFFYFDTTNLNGDPIKQIYEVTSASRSSNFIGFKLHPVGEQITINNLTSKKCLNIHHPLAPSIKDGIKNESLLIIENQTAEISDWDTPPPIPFAPVPFYTLPNTVETAQYLIESNSLPLRMGSHTTDIDTKPVHVQFHNWINLEGLEASINISQNWIPPLFIFCNVYRDFYL